MLIGVISDTHGYLDRRVIPAFAGVDAILHAGDVGRADVLESLKAVAPVYAVYGNNDEKLGGLGLPLHLDVTIAGVRIHLVHQLPQARPEPGTGVVVYGHSHRPRIEWRGDALYVNPGAAGRAGFHRLQTVALLSIAHGRPEARVVELGAREAVSGRARPPRRL